MKLRNEEIEERLAASNGWRKEDEKWIVKKFRFSSYLDGIAFVNRVAEVAEHLNHHPFISIDYKLVTLRITSWHAGGLTALDFTSAEQFEAAYKTA